MSAVKPPHHQMFTLKSSLLTLATLTLISFTFLSLKSLRPASPSSAASSPVLRLDTSEDSSSEVYHTAEIFRLNYAEMERKFKVYIYSDGDPNTFYQTPRKLTGKYASEGDII